MVFIDYLYEAVYQGKETKYVAEKVKESKTKDILTIQEINQEKVRHQSADNEMSLVQIKVNSALTFTR